MKNVLSTLMALCLSLTANARNDTIPEAQKLQEIVVEATNQYVSATGATYIPSKRQKNSATDAVSLLSRMAIPQIDVNPADRTIKTTTGKDIAVYIDFIEASAQDLEGMRTADVKKVEYLLYPEDPRFQGAQYVINFIMHKYEWGGYTKLNAEQSFSVNETSGSLYSKFSYKKMTYDLYVGAQHTSSLHGGLRSTEQFHFTDLFDNGQCDIDRYSQPNSTHSVNNTNGVSFRAIYSSGKNQLTNKISYGIQDNPTDDIENRVDYSGNIFPSSVSRSLKSSARHTWSYDFQFSRTVNSKTSFNILASYVFGHNKSDSRYSEASLVINNYAKENSHYAMVSPQFVWVINQRNSLIPYIFSEYIGHKVIYSGDSPSNQEYAIWGCLGGVRYTYKREKWQAGTQFGLSLTKTKLTGYPVSSDLSPKGNVFATYAPNQKNQFELFYGFGKNIPSINQKSPNMLQQDRLIWYSGNPRLHNYWDNLISINYTWLPDNIWQLNAMSDYYVSTYRTVSDYIPEGPDGTMLRSYINDGDFRRIRLGVAGTGKFLNSRLIAKVNPQLYLQSTTGMYAIRKNIITCSAQLTWYFGNFYMFGWYNTPSTYPESISGIKTHVPSQYRIQIGWGKGVWKVSATASNFLRTDWTVSDQTISGQYYKSYNENYGTSMHQRFQLAVTYTVGYGKKVRTDNEVGEATTNQSAILK
ncbi:MAG: outer membrane beta-barrel family protein [Muribaculaceae bacterium]|nr:outer membrane beta-barrel family protein [Muribaculaceae bacterium]